MDILKKLKRGYFIGATLYLLLGIVLLFMPQTTLRTICYAFAVILGIVGVGYLITYIKNDTLKTYQRNDFVVGLSFLVGAFLVFYKTELIISIFPFLLGIAILISSIIKLQHALDLMRVHFAGWWGILIVAILSSVFGIILITYPFRAAATLVRVIGISCIWNGVTDMFTKILFFRKIHQIKQEHDAIDADAREID